MERSFRLLSRFVIAGTLVIPLVVVPGLTESFRLPKELLFRVEGIIIAAGLAIAFVIDRRATARRFSMHRAALILCSAGVAWTAFTALFSAHRFTSAFAVLWVATALLVFLCVLICGVSLESVCGAMIVAGCANAIFYILQRFAGWNPFVFPPDSYPSLRWSGFLGNPDDVSVSIVIPALVSTILATQHRRFRSWYVAAAILLWGTVVASQVLTAVAAAAVTALAIVFICSRRHFLAASVVAVMGLAALPAFYGPASRKAQQIVDGLRTADIDLLLTGRVLAIRSAVAMIRDHPLVGVGPGCYRNEFFRYKLEAQEGDPALLESESRGFSFGEAHNDHLQVAAETGIFGYILFVAAGLWVAKASWRAPGSNETLNGEFARKCALPLIVAMATLALAQFPFHLVVPTMWFATVAALCRREVP